MKDEELRKLKGIIVPPPLEKAKKQVINKAIYNFDTYQSKITKKSPKLSHKDSHCTGLSYFFKKVRSHFMIKKQAIVRIVLVSVSSVAILMITLTMVREPNDPFNSSKEENELLAQQEQLEFTKVKERTPFADQDSFDSESPIVELSETLADQFVSRSELKKKFRGTLAFPDDKIQSDPSSQGRDRFEEITSNPVKKVSEEPVSTFSVDVDTASYGFIRKFLHQGRLPQKNAVRIEEMIHYFNYQYPSPKNSDPPFKPTIVVYPNP